MADFQKAKAAVREYITAFDKSSTDNLENVLKHHTTEDFKDRDILMLARNHALKLLKNDASMEKPEHENLRKVFIEMSKKKSIWNYIS